MSIFDKFPVISGHVVPSGTIFVSLIPSPRDLAASFDARYLSASISSEIECCSTDPASPATFFGPAALSRIACSRSTPELVLSSLIIFPFRLKPSITFRHTGAKHQFAIVTDGDFQPHLLRRENIPPSHFPHQLCCCFCNSAKLTRGRSVFLPVRNVDNSAPQMDAPTADPTRQSSQWLSGFPERTFHSSTVRPLATVLTRYSATRCSERS